MTDQSDSAAETMNGDERKRQILEEALNQYEQRLLAGIRAYVWKFGLAQNRNAINTLANEIFQDTAVTACEKSENYQPDRPAHAWLLRVAFNHVRHRLRTQRSEYSITLVADTPLAQKQDDPANSRTLSEDELLDLLLQSRNQPFRQGQLTLDEMLSLVNESDRNLLRLAFVENVWGKELAAELGISEGAAYTRTSRAIANLRKAYFQGEQAT